MADTYDSQHRDEYGITDPAWAFRLAPPADPPKISGKAELDALAPGSVFLDPTGTKRTKPYVVKDAASLKAVPDGATFLDPYGTARVKPKYEPIDFGDQILVDMAHGDEARTEAILKGQYGENNVKREPLTNDIYIERDGKKLKPNAGSLLRRGGASLVSSAAPLVAGTAGGILGGIGGSAVPGAGTAAGGVSGAMIGGAAGEAFNQSVLALAGYGSSPVDYIKSLVMEGLGTGAGQAGGNIIGKGIEKAVASTGAVKDAIKGSGSTIAKFLGAQPAETAQAGNLAEKGVLVPPSAWLKETPYLRKIVEVFDPEFRRQNVLKQSAEAYYNSEVPKVLEQMGVKPTAEAATKAAAPVSVEPFGAAMLAFRGAEQHGGQGHATRRCREGGPRCGGGKGRRRSRSCGPRGYLGGASGSGGRSPHGSARRRGHLRLQGDPDRHRQCSETRGNRGEPRRHGALGQRQGSRPAKGRQHPRRKALRCRRRCGGRRSPRSPARSTRRPRRSSIRCPRSSRIATRPS